MSLQTRKKTSSGPFCVDFWNTGTCRRKQVVKQVTELIFSVPGPKQKSTKKHRGKDGRIIGERKPASSEKGKREQTWTEEDMNGVFDDWEKNKELPKHLQKSIREISHDRGIPYTTCCERLKGRRGGGKRGKIAGGKRQSKVLDAGEQVIKRVTFTDRQKQLPAWQSGLRLVLFLLK